MRKAQRYRQCDAYIPPPVNPFPIRVASHFVAAAFDRAAFREAKRILTSPNYLHLPDDETSWAVATVHRLAPTVWTSAPSGSLGAGLDKGEHHGA